MLVAARNGETPFLRYDGRISELYPIFLVNLLLTVLTLGIWRFWAVTRLRRYVWSRTSHDGERFEYDGTGGQLFVGFLLAIGLFFGLGIAAGLLTLLLHAVARPLAFLPTILLYPVVIVLALGAPFSAQRYRLNHTLWSGIRGGMNGSMIRYGLWSALYLLGAAFSFYQLLPWAWLRLYERRINASFLGTQRFESHSRIGPLYLAWLATFVALAVAAGVILVGFWTVEGPTLALLDDARSPALRDQVVAMLLPGLLVAALLFAIASALITCAFQARFLRHISGHTTLGGIHFSSDVRGTAILRLVALNLLIVAVTLGFGLPVVIHRNQRFLCDHLLATGALDRAVLQQGMQAPSRFGEGMYQALDAGVGLV